MARAEGPAGSAEMQVSIRLTTKLPSELQVPKEPLAVPATLTRLGLSKVVNHLLQLDPPRPFDFLIQGELLRTPLEKHLKDRQITAEAILEVEYIPAVLPPELKQQHSHDDWVSAVSGLFLGSNSTLSSESPIATGCYDGTVSIWQNETKSLSFTAHEGPIKGLVSVQMPGNSSEAMILTCGDDCLTRAWHFSSSGATGNKKDTPSALSSNPELVAVLKGHKASIEAIAASPSGNRCATGGWDNKICLWHASSSLIDSANKSAEERGEGSKKKRKVVQATTGDVIPQALHEEQPLIDLEGHTQAISDLCWPSESVLVSGSWDHSITVWDLDVFAKSNKLTHNKAVHCVAAPFSSGGADNGPLRAVAFGGAERAVRIWDPRVSDTVSSSSLPSLVSHTDWVSALAWHPTSEHHIVSASYDKMAKIWDLRATVCPLHTITGHTDKVLCCAWVGQAEVVTGGADNSIHRHVMNAI